MNNEHISIADKLLKLMSENYSNSIDIVGIEDSFQVGFDDTLEESKFLSLVKFVISILAERKLVEWMPNKEILKLTEEGLIAARMGLANYTQQKGKRIQHKSLIIKDSVVNFGDNNGDINYKVNRGSNRKEEKKSTADEWISKIKQNKIISFLFILSLIIIGVGNTTDGLNKIGTFFGLSIQEIKEPILKPEDSSKNEVLKTNSILDKLQIEDSTKSKKDKSNLEVAKNNSSNTKLKGKISDIKSYDEKRGVRKSNNVSNNYDQRTWTANEMNFYNEKPLIEFFTEALNDINPEIIQEYKKGQNPVCVVANSYKIERILNRKKELLANRLVAIEKGPNEFKSNSISGGGTFILGCVNDVEDLNGHLLEYHFKFLENFNP